MHLLTEEKFDIDKCHGIMNCTKTCPKHLNPAAAIAKLKALREDEAVESPADMVFGYVGTAVHDSVNSLSGKHNLLLEKLEEQVKLQVPDATKLEEVKNAQSETQRESERVWATRESDPISSFTSNIIRRLTGKKAQQKSASH